MHPDLPQKVAGQIAFMSRENINPKSVLLSKDPEPFSEADFLSINCAREPIQFLSFREKIRFLKNEKAKKRNLEDQHRWKLGNQPVQLNKALRAELVKERKIL
mmetsp:Transcript_31723/g.48623  ORF Transcript_31723/g.48623 Transcript_31723/m.48623 type:complete len:103 (+) Transcript_31723:3752-4060(+)